MIIPRKCVCGFCASNSRCFVHRALVLFQRALDILCAYSKIGVLIDTLKVK